MKMNNEKIVNNFFLMQYPQVRQFLKNGTMKKKKTLPKMMWSMMLKNKDTWGLSKDPREYYKGRDSKSIPHTTNGNTNEHKNLSHKTVFKETCFTLCQTFKLSTQFIYRREKFRQENTNKLFIKRCFIYIFRYQKSLHFTFDAGVRHLWTNKSLQV